MIEHGVFDHWERGTSEFLINSHEFVSIDNLVGPNLGNDGRRLLSLNICDGGVSDGLGGIQNLGLSPSLASHSLATVSHF